MLMSLFAASLMTASCNSGAKTEKESEGCSSKTECCSEKKSEGCCSDSKSEGCGHDSKSCGSSTLDVAMLSGVWTVAKIAGNDVKAENPVVLEFNAGNKVHAKLGCNIMNTSYEADPKTGAFKFAANGQRTMMMCPDMATEDALVKAMSEVTSAATCQNGIALKNAAGEVIIALKK